MRKVEGANIVVVLGSGAWKRGGWLGGISRGGKVETNVSRSAFLSLSSPSALLGVFCTHVQNALGQPSPINSISPAEINDERARIGRVP